MDGTSDSPVLIIQRSLHSLPFSQHQPLGNPSLQPELSSEHLPPTATHHELSQTSTMSQPQGLQAVPPITPSEPSGTPVADGQTATTASSAVEPATITITNTHSPPSPSSTSDTIPPSDSLPQREAGTPQEDST